MTLDDLKREADALASEFAKSVSDLIMRSIEGGLDPELVVVIVNRAMEKATEGGGDGEGVPG